MEILEVWIVFKALCSPRDLRLNQVRLRRAKQPFLHLFQVLHLLVIASDVKFKTKIFDERHNDR